MVATQEAHLILPSGARINFVRTSPGTSLSDAVFEHTESPTMYYKSLLYPYGALGSGWLLKLKDGTTYVFSENPRLLQRIVDRNGNEIRVYRTQVDYWGWDVGNVVLVTASGGRSLQFTYDADNRVVMAQDNMGRTVRYEYSGSVLWKVTDAEGGGDRVRLRRRRYGDHQGRPGDRVLEE